MFDIAALVTGFTATFVLIATIGAQSAFVLRQGILREHAIRAAIVCLLIDVVFIAIGVAGIGLLIDRIPWALSALRILGAGYLMYLVWTSLKRIREPETLDAVVAGERRDSSAVTRDLVGITLLNAQMYVDLVLIAALAGAFGSVGRWWYYLGAIGASATWFLGLALLGALLAPLFRSRRAWQVLESGTAAVMLAVAWHLVSPLMH